ATIEHAVIEACGLLADGAPAVLLVASDSQLPELFLPFQDCEEQPHAWAWLMTAADAADDPITLRWNASDRAPSSGMPGGLEVAAFHLSGADRMERCDGRMRWCWSRDA
ncbi:MAG TPA: beta-ketoacyl synthase chain length factor, partial [Duganella sp.]|nr:beta-ketoacyl synthase chain length factor [Duganella sp.]